jgi:hypothetical protein
MRLGKNRALTMFECKARMLYFQEVLGKKIVFGNLLS